MPSFADLRVLLIIKNMRDERKCRRVILVSAFATAIVLIVAVFTLIHRSFRGAVAASLSTAKQSREFQNDIGEPACVKFMTTGRIFEKGGIGNADLVIRVEGPNGTGKLLEWAQAEGGKWHVCSLTLQLPNGSKGIEIVPDADSHCERE